LAPTKITIGWPQIWGQPIVIFIWVGPMFFIEKKIKRLKNKTFKKKIKCLKIQL